MAKTACEKGAEGEELAASFLREHGYQIAERNLHCPYGELDIVARRGDDLLFVEIRRRVVGDYGGAVESLAPTKIARWRRAAEFFYLNRRDWWGLTPYLSVIAIDEDGAGGEPEIEFLPNAVE